MGLHCLTGGWGGGAYKPLFMVSLVSSFIPSCWLLMRVLTVLKNHVRIKCLVSLQISKNNNNLSQHELEHPSYTSKVYLCEIRPKLSFCSEFSS